jgi:hypothetical protein
MRDVSSTTPSRKLAFRASIKACTRTFTTGPARRTDLQQRVRVANRRTTSNVLSPLRLGITGDASGVGCLPISTFTSTAASAPRASAMRPAVARAVPTSPKITICAFRCRSPLSPCQAFGGTASMVSAQQTESCDACRTEGPHTAPTARPTHDAARRHPRVGGAAAASAMRGRTVGGSFVGGAAEGTDLEGDCCGRLFLAGSASTLTATAVIQQLEPRQPSRCARASNLSCAPSM